MILVCCDWFISYIDGESLNTFSPRILNVSNTFVMDDCFFLGNVVTIRGDDIELSHASLNCSGDFCFSLLGAVS